MGKIIYKSEYQNNLMKNIIKSSCFYGVLFFATTFPLFNPSFGSNSPQSFLKSCVESELEERIDIIRKNVAERYVDSYLSEARERVGTIENLVDERGYGYVREIFMDEQEVPFSVLRGEIDLDEAVSEISRLYRKVDDRMNWNSRHITPKIREDIEFKVSMYREMIEDGRYSVNKDEVEELIDLSEGLLDGIKDELRANSKYVGIIPGGRFVMLLIADKMMNPSRKATRKAYMSLLEEEGSERRNENK